MVVVLCYRCEAINDIMSNADSFICNQCSFYQDTPEYIFYGRSRNNDLQSVNYSGG